MSIKENDINGATVLTVTKKHIDETEAVLLGKKVGNKLDKNQKKFVIDLKNVKWIGSTGLSGLFACYDSIITKQGEIKLVGVSDKVIGMMNVTNVINLFDNYKNVDDAVKSFH